MKFLCKTQDLLQALTLVSRAISNQQALPILGNILIVAEGKKCTVSATDLELSIITSFNVDIENEGSITVPSRAILNFAQYNSDDQVLLETHEGTQLKCSSPHAKTMISGEAASEYPTISHIEKETKFSIQTAPLLDALHLVTFASAKTTLRPVLAGVYIRSEKDHLILVATDSYRLSEYQIPSKGGEGNISCIVPAKVLEELRSILASSKGEKRGKGEAHEVPEVNIALSTQQIEIRIGQTQLLSRLIEGKFPDYKQIIPQETKTKVAVKTSDLITIAKRMHYFARETNNNLTWTVRKSNNTLHISTPHTQAGRDEATLDIEMTGDDNKIALSSSYLLDFLGHVNDDVTEVHLTDSMHPAVFRLPSDKNLLHLIMPLRIQEE
ncbi:DNA polymerase III subunit beta [Candidatus Peregrinibacteria bacterium]|nr:DNA polymerase III subunit beta [Candidatus Peregrinibacteria bacterium]